ASRSRFQQHDVPTVGPPELFQLGPQQPDKSVDVSARECGEKTDAAWRRLALRPRNGGQRQQSAARSGAECPANTHRIPSSTNLTTPPSAASAPWASCYFQATWTVTLTGRLWP